MEKPKVLYISPNGYRGGAEKFVLENTRLHLESGVYDPYVLFLNEGPLVEQVRQLGAHAIVLPFVLKMSLPWTAIRACWFILKTIIGHRFSVVHSTMAYAHILAAPACILTNTPEVWFQHGPVGSFWDKIAKLLPATKTLFNSKFLQNEHNKLFGPSFDEDQLIFSLGVDVDKDSKFERSKICNDSQKLILWVGRIARGKGLHLAVDALSHLDIDEDFHFLIVGDATTREDDVYLKGIHEKIEEYKLKSKITFLHKQTNISQFYNVSNVLIHTAVIPESFGLVVAEAMAHHLLVVASSHGGVADLVGKDRGIRYDSFSRNAAIVLAGILSQVFSASESEIKSMTDIAQKYVEEKHTSPRMNQQLELIYRRLL